MPSPFPGMDPYNVSTVKAEAELIWLDDLLWEQEIR